MKKLSSLLVAATLFGAFGFASAEAAPTARRPASKVRTAPVQTPKRVLPRSQRFRCRAACRGHRGLCMRRGNHAETCNVNARRCYRSCNQYPATKYAPGLPLGR